MGKRKRRLPICDSTGLPLGRGSWVRFDDPRLGPSVGVVVQLLRGSLGPVAVVEVAPGTQPWVFCDRVRWAG